MGSELNRTLLDAPYTTFDYTSFASLQLLMLSGIGPKGHLAKHQISCVVDLPGLGENLQDHLECHIPIETKQPVSLNKEL
ncbi:GMC family oxidoreductase N-terminal domain-containing protein [Oceanospirillaceae bacterium]|nr:GMC family oxidoreductase N-terminal domain-containing protein [Oceanospirillaceae bacterium]